LLEGVRVKDSVAMVEEESVAAGKLNWKRAVLTNLLDLDDSPIQGLHPSCR
jgi:ethanolamine utilization protein EutQ (cupin superfamily)